MAGICCLAVVAVAAMALTPRESDVVVAPSSSQARSLLAPTNGVMAPGYRLARRAPAPDDVVTVLDVEPFRTRFSKLARLEVAPGTLVLDGDGAVVAKIDADGRPRILVIDVPGSVVIETAATDAKR